RTGDPRAIERDLVQWHGDHRYDGIARKQQDFWQYRARHRPNPQCPGSAVVDSGTQASSAALCLKSQAAGRTQADAPGAGRPGFLCVEGETLRRNRRSDGRRTPASGDPEMVSLKVVSSQDASSRRYALTALRL